MPARPAPVKEIKGARVLAKLGDSVTTDHISPAGSIKANSPAGKYLQEHGVPPSDFNSYGSRRGNHEVMARGTFANVRLRNQLAPGLEGGITKHFPSGEIMSIFDASVKYIADGVPTDCAGGQRIWIGLIARLGGKRPSAAGLRAVIAESYERIHRSNLVGMGILPLQFLAEENAESLGLQGDEVFEIVGLPALLASKFANGKQVQVRPRADGNVNELSALVRIDTPQEILYYEHGGILQYVLRQLLANKKEGRRRLAQMKQILPAN